MSKQMPPEMTVRPFDPLTASDDDWARLHAYRRAWHADRRPGEPVYPDELDEKDRKAEAASPRSENHRYHVERGGEIVAVGGVGWQTPESPGYESGKHLVQCYAYVTPAERRRGIATALMRTAVSHLDTDVHKVVGAWTEDGLGDGFLCWLGFEKRQEGAENRLDLRELDWDMVEDWAREGAERSPDSRIQFLLDRVPDEMMDDWCVVRQDLFNLMPTDDLDKGETVVTPESVEHHMYRWLRDSGATWHCALAVAADGAIEGMTDVAFAPHRPDRVQQWLTGVGKDYRGRGLGKRLKAAMLLLIRDDYPDVRWIVTDNATSNAPMLSINDRLGFKQHRTYAAYQIERGKLATFLESV